MQRSQLLAMVTWRSLCLGIKWIQIYRRISWVGAGITGESPFRKHNTAVMSAPTEALRKSVHGFPYLGNFGKKKRTSQIYISQYNVEPGNESSDAYKTPKHYGRMGSSISAAFLEHSLISNTDKSTLWVWPSMALCLNFWKKAHVHKWHEMC